MAVLSVPTPQYKVVFLGDNGVGKTTAIRNILGTSSPPRPLRVVEQFDEDIAAASTMEDGHTPTLGVDVYPLYVEAVRGDGLRVKMVLNMWDTAGNSRSTDRYCHRADGGIAMCRDASEVSRAMYWNSLFRRVVDLAPMVAMHRESDFHDTVRDILRKIRGDENLEVVGIH